ncbi:MAG: cupredoxin domain-containing protein [Patescibacteria group bacterium]
MTKKKLFILIGIIILIGIVILISQLGRGDKKITPKEGEITSEVNPVVPDLTPTGPITREEVPENIVAPELGEKPTNEKIAVPETVVEAAPGAESKFRQFEILAEKDAYLPSEIIVNQNDIVHIGFTAVDKTYDLTFPDYGMKQTAKIGETKILEFQAVSTGKFLYYCDLCGGIEGKVQGHIIVVPKK